MKLLIVTGMSGAGKSYGVKFLEDFGYYCVDNMPPALLPKFTDLYIKSDKDFGKIALVMDVRTRELLGEVVPNLLQLEKSGIDFEILFLDCSDDVLIKRFKENRRPHPLSPSGNLVEGIANERDKLKAIKERADYIVDTTRLSPWDLKRELNELFNEDRKGKGLKINVISFGFKHGLPSVCDLVFDVRFIPNPHYIPELKPFTGNDEPVYSYVLSQQETKIFLHKLLDMLKFLIPCYEKEGKEILVIGIGCTGGKHRSVAIANETARLLSTMGYGMAVEHNDVEK